MSAEAVPIKAAVARGDIYIQEKKPVDCFAITCALHTMTTPLRSYARLSRSYTLTWRTPRRYVAGRVAVSTSG